MELVKFCLKKINMISESYYLNSTIETVCENGNVDVLKNLLNDVKNNNDQNLIEKLFINACHKNNTDIIEYLFNEKMSDVVPKQTFLSEMFATMCESPTVTIETLHLLKTLGADINYQNSLPCANCCKSGRIDIFIWLLTQGTNAPNDDDLLSYLASTGQINIIRRLYGDDVFRTKMNPNIITRDFLLKNGYDDTLDWMEDCCSQTSDIPQI